jgi:FMN phosphatase YigB (HAD superfamily)
VRAILFDLDGTLLDLDLNAFLKHYFAALDTASARLAERCAPGLFMPPHHAAVGTMMEPHPGRTNRDVFYDDLLARTGVDLNEHWSTYERFYRDVFPTLGDTAGPARGARRAVTTALDLGLEVAIATNPIFPRAAVDHRLGWAGLGDLTFSVVTTYEGMVACKPHADYFRQTAELLGMSPQDCLMVGDDRALDMPAADVGMRTYYVGTDESALADMRGDLDELADLLPRIV